MNAPLEALRALKSSHAPYMQILGMGAELLQHSQMRVHTKKVGTSLAEGHADGVRLAAEPPNEPHHASPAQGDANYYRMHPSNAVSCRAWERLV